MDITKLLKNSLKDSLEPSLGCGSIEYRVDGNKLYDRVYAIVEMMEAEQEKPSQTSPFLARVNQMHRNRRDK